MNYMHGRFIHSIKRQTPTMINSNFTSIVLDFFQDELIEFFRLQMKCHHPQGVMTEDTGVYAVDMDLWKVCICII